MKQEIIEKLRSELNDTYWCQNDFEKYDIESFKERDEPFLFLIRENGTCLVFVGPSLEYKLRSEANRFRVMRDHEWMIKDFLFYQENGIKYFYYDGYILNEISKKEEIRDIFKNIWGWRLSQLAGEYPEEYELKDVSPEVIMDDLIQVKMDECLRLSTRRGDQSLVKILNRFRSKERMAIDHGIRIYSEGDYGFYFEEKINGICVLNGGILFHESGGVWSVHT